LQPNHLLREFVSLAAKGTHEGNACVSIDLYRVVNEGIVEHWGFAEMVSAAAEGTNGML
jgi:predicted SnoaL-like aldol condensation-catalyzing enzyme